MAKTTKLKLVNRPLTRDERKRAATIREGVQKDFPPKAASRRDPPVGIASRIQAVRERRGMTRYEVGRTANVPSTVVRAIEQGDDVPLSQFRAVLAVLGLNMELVEQT